MVDPVKHREAIDRPVSRVLQVVATAPVVVADRAGRPEPDTAAVRGVAAQLAIKPPVDAERVAQIKKAIANGTFPISPATIADRMLALRYDWIADEQA